jgi:hypothetical protein
VCSVEACRLGSQSCGECTAMDPQTQQGQSLQMPTNNACQLPWLLGLIAAIDPLYNMHCFFDSLAA